MKKNQEFTSHLSGWGRVKQLSSNKKDDGFTLIELLIVIAIISILAAIIFVAVDPARRLAEARNAERWSSANSILNAYLKYTVDNAGSPPATLNAGTAYMIGTGSNATGCETAGGGTATTTTAVVDLSALVDEYLVSIPVDPNLSEADATKTYYYIYRSSSGRITVGACGAEEVGGSTPTIRVAR